MSQFKGQVTHALLTRPPLTSINFLRRFCPWSSVRLACVKHAASVRPEPGSNSPCKISHEASLLLLISTSVSTSRTFSSSFRSFLSSLMSYFPLTKTLCPPRISLRARLLTSTYCSVPKDQVFYRASSERFYNIPLSSGNVNTFFQFF